MKVQITLNGEKTVLNAQPDATLLEILRGMNLCSVKCGCRKGICGSCTVLMNGKTVSSCKIPVAIIRNCQIETLEHFRETDEYESIMKGFDKAGISLCGYCNSGKIFAAYTLLKQHSIPSDEDIERQIKGLAPCCTDKETLISGIKYALAFNKKNDTITSVQNELNNKSIKIR